MKKPYLESIALIERLHRHFLDVVRTDLESMGVKDINNVQALILFNVGEQDLTVGELTSRGYYLGTNVTYNLKKLVEMGYVAHQRSTHDRRAVRVSLTQKGKELLQKMDAAFQSQAEQLGKTSLTPDALTGVNLTLRNLEGFWSDSLVRGAGARGSHKAA